MKVFRELTFRSLGGLDVSELAARLEGVSGAWPRDREAEQQVGQPDYICFRHASEPGARLWIAPRAGDALELYVSNVVPIDRRELRTDEYNAIVLAFHDEVALRACRDLGVDVTLGPDVLSIRQWLSPATADLLLRFTRLANRDTGSSHPHDRERWFSFICAVHRDHAPLSSGDLQQWLEEDDGWGHTRAATLASQYECARALLEAYDRSDGR